MSPTKRHEKELEGNQQTVAAARSRLQVVQHRLHECFTDDGAIKPMGLKLRQSDLDEIRRTETNPLDGNQQSLIQGQQNEIEKLMNLQPDMKTEVDNLQMTISGLEQEANELRQSIQRRQGNG